MESYILISSLNDFIFCPRSIYFHNLYNNLEQNLYKDSPQVAGTLNHRLIDTRNYSTSKDILQGTAVFSEKYNLMGRIDCFHMSKKSLIERKTAIKEVYQGYIYQLYAQYFCLTEMGYEVDHLKLYSLEDNKGYPIKIPDNAEKEKFENFLAEYRSYSFDNQKIVANPEKCRRCIYHELCDQDASIE